MDNTAGECLEGSTETLNSSLSTQLASGIPSGDSRAMYQNPEQSEHEMEVELPPLDQIEDSDMEETDVKVCDICGDCGKEDSLATCCRCSDGAEHIYCMREMLDKVPDGDWMCEECMHMELVTNEKPLKIERVDETETNNSKENSCYIEGQSSRGCMKTPGKRLDADADANVSSIDSKGKLEDQTVDLKEGITRSDIQCTKQQSSSQHPPIHSMNETSCSSTPIIDKEPASSCKSSQLTTITNHDDEIDEKSAAVSRTSSLSSQKKADISSSLGEFDRPTLHGHSTLGVSSTFGTECTELKSKQANPKAEDISLPIESEALPLSEDLPNGLPQSSNFASSGVGMIENSGNHFQPSSIKSSKDEGDILKAAIEAALLRKPGLCQKRKALSQPDDSSFISTVAHRTGLYSGGGGAVPTVSSDGKSSLRETLIKIQVAMPVFLKTLVIPAHEYIWQGSFEICRSGKISDSWDGIQAHMSRLASPKVMEAVNKFTNRIILYEVPRSSTWPLQFQEHGVIEENVALFFFAKDVESYNKIYKLLLDNMMKNDLALKGNFNGVELLIFPSNQLPDNSQRWNTLFFLWGVFRGEKQSCSQHITEPLGHLKSSHDMPPAILSLPPNRCSLGPITDHLVVSQPTATAPEVLNAAELCSLLSSETLNGDCSMKKSPSDHPDGGHFSCPTVAVQSDSARHCQGLSIMSLEGGGVSSAAKLPQQAETESS